MSEMTLDEALKFADILGDLNGRFNETEFKSEVTLTLAAEVRRLRAGVEAVRALPRLLFVNSNGWMLNRDDVLAALDGGADD